MGRIFWAAALLACIGPAPAAQAQTQGGAFGLTMGQPLAALKVSRKVDDYHYVVSVPRPHPEFEAYTVIVTPGAGLCRVTGIGKTHGDDRYGSATRTAFDSLLQALKSRYGASKDFDFLKSGALWKDSDEWVMAINQNERNLASFWDREEGSAMPPGLASIGLTARATSSTDSYVTLSYEFANIERCQAERAASNNSGL